MKKTALTFGGLSGLIIILYSVITFAAFGDFDEFASGDLEKLEVLGYLRYVILLLGVLFAIRAYKQQHGPSGFKPLFLAGLYTALFTGVLVGLMELVYMLVYPNFFDKYVSITTEKMRSSGASAAELEQLRKQWEAFSWMRNPVLTGLFYFFETSLIGTLLSVIFALLFRKKKSANQRAAASAQ